MKRKTRALKGCRNDIKELGLCSEGDVEPLKCFKQGVDGPWCQEDEAVVKIQARGNDGPIYGIGNGG